MSLQLHPDPATCSRLKSYVEFSDPQTLETALKEAEDIFSYRLQLGSDKFFGFVPGPANFVSKLGACLTSMHNVHAGNFMCGPGVSVLEAELMLWLARKIGLPETSGGLFCSGGSMANLMGLTVARDQRLGCENIHRGIIYVSDQTHFSVQKALHVLGFAEHQVVQLQTDERLRIKPCHLRERLRQDRMVGKMPFAVVATCGTTNVGAIDPLREISEITKAEGLWLHVDGAYGASVVLSNSYYESADGLNLADSIAWDGHKWLFQTFDCGMLFLRDKLCLTKSFAKSAEYVQDAEDDEAINFCDMGIELTRPARAVKLWLTLRTIGLSKLGDMIDHGIKIAEFAQSRLAQDHDTWEILSPAQLGILVFRFRPAPNTHNIDDLNRKISKALLQEGVAGILTTTLHDKLALRMCIINPDSTEEMIVEIIDSAKAIGLRILEEGIGK